MEKTKWAITGPTWDKRLQFVVRNSANKKIMGSIMGVPKKLNILGTNKKVKL